MKNQDAICFVGLMVLGTMCFAAAFTVEVAKLLTLSALEPDSWTYGRVMTQLAPLYAFCGAQILSVLAFLTWPASSCFSSTRAKRLVTLVAAALVVVLVYCQLLFVVYGMLPATVLLMKKTRDCG